MKHENVINAVMRVRAQVDNAQQAANAMKAAFNNVNTDKGLGKSFNDDFKKLEQLADKYQELQKDLNSGKMSDSDMSKLVKTSSEYEKVLNRLIAKFKNLNSFDLKNAIGSDDYTKALQEEIEQAEFALKQKMTPALTEASQAAETLFGKGKKKGFDFSKISLDPNELKKDIEELKKEINDQDFKDAGNSASTILQKITGGVNELNKKIRSTKGQITKTNKEIQKTQADLDAKTKAAPQKGLLSSAAIANREQAIANANTPTASAAQQTFSTMGSNLVAASNTAKSAWQADINTVQQAKKEFEKAAADLMQAQQDLENKKASVLEPAKQAFSSALQTETQTKEKLKAATDTISAYKTKFDGLIPKKAEKDFTSFFKDLQTPQKFQSLEDFQKAVRQTRETLKSKGADEKTLKRFSAIFNKNFYSDNIESLNAAGLDNDKASKSALAKAKAYKNAQQQAADIVQNDTTVSTARKKKVDAEDTYNKSIKQQYENRAKIIEEAGKKINDALNDFDSTSGDMESVTSNLAKASSYGNKDDLNINEVESYLKRAKKAVENYNKEMQKYDAATHTGNKTGQQAAMQKAETAASSAFDNINSAGQQVQATIDAITNRIAFLQNEISQSQTADADVAKYTAEVKALKDALKGLEQKKAALEQTQTELQDAQTTLSGVAGGFSKIDNVLNTLGTSGNPKLEEMAEEIEALKQSLSDEEADLLADIVEKFLNLGEAGDDASGGLHETSEGASDLIGNVQQTDSEIASLIERFAGFTTLSGIFDIFKTAIQDAFAAVQELDEAMNSIAVVTDMTTQDLWDQIDAYTQMANETGSTIAGTYQVAQLYYQQGLSTNEVLTATTETLKLARIAGIEYADATDYMTSAVKGFALSYEDLTHVMDVYSNLAAKTAADTEEISIAMSKVASIAYSTGMSLENTAGFLTQIIATTREAPEQLGA